MDIPDQFEADDDLLARSPAPRFRRTHSSDFDDDFEDDEQLEQAQPAASTISKRASAALLLALSGALLHLSGALPVAWPWIKPLLEAAAKVVGG